MLAFTEGVQHMAIDIDKLNAFIGRFVGDLGAAVHTGMVVIGERLGLYKALAAQPMTSSELAAKTETDERYVREWLASQAAGGYVTYDEKTNKFSLTEEQAFTLANEDSPAYLPGAFQLALGSLAAVPRIAESFPKCKLFGFDYHDKSIEAARETAKREGVADRVTFEVAKAKEFPGKNYDFVAVFDCLHDMGDPIGAAKHVHQSLRPDGTWMIVEPFANDELKDNLNPVGRVYYSFSTLLCTPCSRSQEVGLCLGAQAGEARIRDVVTSAGFSKFRRATETPFNIVYEARP